MATVKTHWDWEVGTKTSYWSWGIKEIWSYRHLLTGLVRRYFILNYQQTVLGPFWMLFQPLITLVTYVFVFYKLVGISTGTLPPVLFYFSGIVLWNFFSDSFNGTSSTFRDNAQIFSKVYFPRLVMPLSVVSTHLLRFGMQMVFLVLLIGYYSIFRELSLQLNYWLLALPAVILCLGAISLGLGLIFSVVTTKYRDLANLVSLGIRQLMFVTPVIYPLGAVPEKVRWIVQLNPLTPLFELFRLALLGEGLVHLPQLLYSVLFMAVTLAGALLLFNKQGDKLIDVV